jgi:hypothetical protein
MTVVVVRRRILAELQIKVYFLNKIKGEVEDLIGAGLSFERGGGGGSLASLGPHLCERDEADATNNRERT